MSTQRWVFLLLTSLCLAVVTFAWLVRPTFCLDSRLVERIDSVSAEGTESILTCATGRGGVFSPTLFNLKDGLEARFRFLERSLDFMQVSAQPLKISLVDTLDPLVRVNATHLILSRKTLENDQVLEKAILLALLLQRSASQQKPLSGDQILWAEVFSDLFLAFEKGSFSVEDPILNKTIQWKGKRIQWPFALKTQNTYCLDPWRSFYHLSECQGDELTSDQLFVSLRPLFGSSLDQALMSLPVYDRVEWFRDVWKHWSELPIEKYLYASSMGPKDKQQIVESRLGVENWIKNFRFWSSRNRIWSALAQSFESEIKKQGFQADDQITHADLLVIDGEQGANWTLKSIGEASLSNSSKTVLYLKGNSTRLLPDLKPFPKLWLGQIQAHQVVLIQCTVPSIETMKQLAESVQKLLLITTCEAPANVVWNQIMQGDLEGFIRDNPKLPFIKFDLPSLKSALAKKNLNPIPLLAEGHWDGPFFREIGWGIPLWDKSLRAYRTRAANDAIESFRFEHDVKSAPL